MKTILKIKRVIVLSPVIMSCPSSKTTNITVAVGICVENVFMKKVNNAVGLLSILSLTGGESLTNRSEEVMNLIN